MFQIQPREDPWAACRLGILWWNCSTSLHPFKWETEIQYCKSLYSFWPWERTRQLLKETFSAKPSLRCGPCVFPEMAFKVTVWSLTLVWLSLQDWESTSLVATHKRAGFQVLLPWYGEGEDRTENHAEEEQVFTITPNIASPTTS